MQNEQQSVCSILSSTDNKADDDFQTERVCVFKERIFYENKSLQ
jgi:hypothetical protein